MWKLLLLLACALFVVWFTREDADPVRRPLVKTRERIITVKPEQPVRGILANSLPWDDPEREQAKVPTWQPWSNGNSGLLSGEYGDVQVFGTVGPSNINEAIKVSTTSQDYTSYIPVPERTFEMTLSESPNSLGEDVVFSSGVPIANTYIVEGVNTVAVYEEHVSEQGAVEGIDGDENKEPPQIGEPQGAEEIDF